MGNALLDPEKTITYEIGLCQELTRGMNLDVALFYKEIYYKEKTPASTR